MSDDLLTFVCPRHGGEPVSERFYGPCTPCREELVAKMVGEKRDVEVEKFAGKVHVQQNAVAQAAEKD